MIRTTSIDPNNEVHLTELLRDSTDVYHPEHSRSPRETSPKNIFHQDSSPKHDLVFQDDSSPKNERMKPEMLHHEDYAEPLDRSPKVRRASGSIMGSFSRVPQSYEDRLFPNIDPLKSSGKGMDLKGMNVKALEGKTRRESSEIEKRKGSLDAEKRKESLESAKSSLKSPHDVNSMKNSFVKSPNDPIMRSKTPPRDKMSSSPGRKELASPRKTSAEIQDQGRGSF